MRICFDLDGTLCTGYPYATAKPLSGVADLLKRLKKAGHTIIIYTARGMGSTGANQGRAVRSIGKLTLQQLDKWGFVYDEIIFGKPAADLYVDDKAFLACRLSKLEEFLEGAEGKICEGEAYMGKLEGKIYGLVSKIDELIRG